MRPEVVAAMTPVFTEDFGNPSSIHWFGQHAKSLIDDARKHVAKLINAETAEIIFVSGGTGEPAVAFMRRYGASLVSSLVGWTGQPKYTVTGLVRRLTRRAQDLDLRAPEGDDARVRVRVELAAYLSWMVTNHLHTGRFKRSV